MFLLSALSAESKKETNSLRPLRLCGDYKLSNNNTIPYLRIRVLSVARPQIVELYNKGGMFSDTRRRISQ